MAYGSIPLTDKPSYCHESGCPLANSGKGFCLGVGDPKTAKLALNLEAPGYEEINFRLTPNADRDFLDTPEKVAAELARRKERYPELEPQFRVYGAPVVGKSGSELNQWVLPAAGLKRDEIFIDNTLRCLPPKQKNGQYPIGEDRKKAEQCCRHYDRWDEFKPDIQVATLHPAGIIREVTPLPLQIKDFEKARDFVSQGLRVMMLVGGKAMKAFWKWTENITKLRGHYQFVPTDWLETYKASFAFVGKKKKNPKETPVRPIEVSPEPCKSFKRYKGKRPPKCGCAPCWDKWEEVNAGIVNQT